MTLLFVRVSLQACTVLVRYSKWLTVLVLVLTMGGHWAFLQGVAWVGMAANYSQTETFSEALSKTFDGEHPCRLCKFVSEGKKAEKDSDAQLDVKKLDSATFAMSEFFFPRLQQTSLCNPLFLLPRGNAPPTPPPLFA